MRLTFLTAVLLSMLPRLATAQVAILHIQVVEGEGAVHAPGARIIRPLTVLVSDETGKPVEGASVSFHLPEDGPGGAFGNGLRTDVSTTDSNGRANLHSMQVNRTPGRFQIRVVASKEQARAGAVAFQYVAETKLAAQNTGSSRTATVSHGKLKWVVVAALAGGAAAAGAIVGAHGNGSQTSPVTAATPVSIGVPTLTVSKP